LGGIGGKPQRMFLLTVTALTAAILHQPLTISIGLALLCVAAAATVAYRLILVRNYLYAHR
jgi:hypothetical protein